MNKSNKLECKECKEKYEGRCRKICETDQQRNPDKKGRCRKICKENAERNPETGRCNKSPKSKKSKMEEEDEEINIILVLPREQMITIKKNDINMIKTIAISLQIDDRDIDIYYEDNFIEYGLSPLDCGITKNSRITVVEYARIKTKESLKYFINELFIINDIKDNINDILEKMSNANYYKVIDYFFEKYRYKIKNLPESFGRLDIKGTLNLSNNQLKSLPESFGRLKLGGDLNLSENELTSLPESFGRLDIKGNLNLHNNQLKLLPESFGNIKVGGNLNLSNNQLKSLPESFGNIKVGGSLVLFNNQLKSLPESFERLKISGNLYLAGNQIVKKIKM